MLLCPKARSSDLQGGDQPGLGGAYRTPLPVEQVNALVAVVPERCRQCEQRFHEATARHRGRVWRQQVMELLPLAMRVTEYQMAVRRCAARGCRTRASLPPGLPRRPFGAGLAAVLVLLSVRCRLSRRDVRHMLRDLRAVWVSLGAVVGQEQAQSAALAPIVEEAWAAVLQAQAVNLDETGWRQDQRRAWLWTVVSAELFNPSAPAGGLNASRGRTRAVHRRSAVV